MGIHRWFNITQPCAVIFVCALSGMCSHFSPLLHSLSTSGSDLCLLILSCYGVSLVFTTRKHVWLIWEDLLNFYSKLIVLSYPRCDHDVNFMVWLGDSSVKFSWNWEKRIIYHCWRLSRFFYFHLSSKLKYYYHVWGYDVTLVFS